MIVTLEHVLMAAHVWMVLTPLPAAVPRAIMAPSVKQVRQNGGALIDVNVRTFFKRRFVQRLLLSCNKRTMGYKEVTYSLHVCFVSM